MDINIDEALRIIGYFWKHQIFTISGIKITLGNLTIALIFLLFSGRLSRMVAKQINKRLIIPFVPEKSSQTTYQTFVFYGCLASFVALSLTIAGIPLTVFTVLGGALAIGVGFGSQNIVNNFISGVILLVEQPIKVGDVVEVEGMSGTVLSIGTRSTKIKNIENKIFIIPNSFFLEKSVLNWTYEQTVVRTTVSFGVAYGSNVRMVEHICMDILLNTEGIEQSPLPLIEFNDFSDSTLNFNLIFFANLEKVDSLAQLRSEVRFKIDDKFRQHDVQMAFPQRDVNLKLEKTLEVKVLS